MTTNKRKTRNTITLLTLLLFPVIMNFMSPYLSVMGAMNGIISGSVIVFILFFFSGLFFGRLWCSHGCPMAALSNYTATINDRRVSRRKLRIIRYSIFAVWFTFLLLGFILAGGIKGIDPLYMTETGISIDEPFKYIIYYIVLGTFLLISVLIGKRAACHSICWMSPFMIAGMKLGEVLHIPQWKVRSNPDLCIDCNKCTKVCPMSIDVAKDLREGFIRTQDCILCGDCVDTCPKDVLHLGFK